MNLTIQPYEVTVVLFGVISVAVVYTTSFHFPAKLAVAFAIKVVELTALVCALSLLIIAARFIRFGVSEGFTQLKNRTVWTKLVLPYASVNYLVLTFRRIR